MANTPTRNFRISPELSAQITALRQAWGCESDTEVLRRAVNQAHEKMIVVRQSAENFPKPRKRANKACAT
jgi:hypothetical protein